MMFFSYSKAIAHVVENFLNRNEMQPDSDDAHVLNQLLEVLACPDQKPDDSEQ